MNSPRWSLPWFVAALLAGCAAGPDFVRPEPPSDQRYTSEPALPEGRPGAPQHVDAARQLGDKWWELFRSPTLEAVVRLALEQNHTLDAAHASLAAAQENAAAARGALFPQIDGSISAQRSKTGALTADLYHVGGTVSYSADIFAAIRRRVEQQEALAEFQNYQLAAAWLAVTGTTVSESIAIAAARAQMEALEEVIRSDQENLDLVRQEFDAGKVPRTDVLTAETQLASDRALLPPLQQQLAAAQHALAVLVGRSSGEWSVPAFVLQEFALPDTLPLSLPSELVRQRPDILAAEAQLHAANAGVGIATAQIYPSITLSGSFATEGASLFSGNGNIWSLSGTVLAPLFHGGTLNAQRRAAIATYKATLATYKQTVLQGFQQVADTLQALAHDTELVDAEQAALAGATELLRLQRIGYGAGKTTLLTLIDAQRVYQQTRAALVRAQAQRLQDTAELFVALGGGWWEAAP